MNVWEVTSRSSTPVMWCASDGDISDAVTYRLVKDLLKKAKQHDLSINVITVSADEGGQFVSLFGTANAYHS